MICFLLRSWTKEIVENILYFLWPLLTLIVPGAVKIDLADFGVKCWQTSYVRDKKIPIPAEKSQKLIELYSGCQKMIFGCAFNEFMSKIWLRHHLANPLRLVFLLFQTTQSRHNFRCTEVCILAQCQSTLKSSSDPVTNTLPSVGSAFSLFQSRSKLDHHSGPVLGTVALYNMPCNRQRRCV